MKKLIKLAAVAAMLTGTLALAPTAQAHPADTAVDCVVDGTVNTNFATYKFVSSTLTCAGIVDGVPMVGSYDVNATGPTKGLVDPTGPETCDEGQSAGSGVISAGLDPSQPNSGAPESFAGTVDFTRVGLNVVATGTLADGVTGHLVDFAADLVFTPTNLNPADCVGGTPASLDALLTGDAVLTDG